MESFIIFMIIVLGVCLFGKVMSLTIGVYPRVEYFSMGLDIFDIGLYIVAIAWGLALVT